MPGIGVWFPASFMYQICSFVASNLCKITWTRPKLHKNCNKNDVWPSVIKLQNQFFIAWILFSIIILSNPYALTYKRMWHEWWTFRALNYSLISFSAYREIYVARDQPYYWWSKNLAEVQLKFSTMISLFWNNLFHKKFLQMGEVLWVGRSI